MSPSHGCFVHLYCPASHSSAPVSCWRLLSVKQTHWENGGHSGFLGTCLDTWKSVRPSFSKQKFPFCLLGHKSLDDARNVLLSAWRDLAEVFQPGSFKNITGKKIPLFWLLQYMGLCPGSASARPSTHAENIRLCMLSVRSWPLLRLHNDAEVWELKIPLTSFLNSHCLHEAKWNSDPAIERL